MIETGDLAGKRVDRPCDTPDGTREVVVRDRPDCPLSPYFANLFITMPLMQFQWASWSALSHASVNGPPSAYQ